MRKTIFIGLIGVTSLSAAIGSACGGGSDTDTGSGGEAGSSGEGASGPGATTGNPSGGGFNPMTTGAGGSTGDCVSGDTEDKDMDGFTKVDGDCNDCDANVNPGAIEVSVTEPQGDGGIPEPADEDCDGTIDNVPPLCDSGIPFDDQDPKNGARAIDLCQEAVGMKWGVMSASYVRADGTPYTNAPGLQFGVLDGFGPAVNVQLGERMLALSSGHARLPGQADACGTYSCGTNFGGTPPPGFPAVVPGCMGLDTINDDLGLQLKVRAPSNATGYQFLFKFYSFEFPEYVCTSFNDQFIALVDPPPMGAMNGNITFDSNSNPVSVNIAFFDVCDPAGIGNFGLYSPAPPPPPNPYCPSGTAELQGNGFDSSWGQDAGGTSWLATTAPVTGGEEFDIRFAIWDTGDSAWDSTVLVDGFQWIANGGTVNVGTDPIEDPK